MKDMNKFQRKYAELAHAVQSGIAACMAVGWGGADPKHLRVGIDTSKSDQGALVKLLIEKGVITEDEYGQALIEGLEKEVKSFEGLFENLTGGKTAKFH